MTQAVIYSLFVIAACGSANNCGLLVGFIADFEVFQR